MVFHFRIQTVQHRLGSYGTSITMVQKEESDYLVREGENPLSGSNYILSGTG